MDASGRSRFGAALRRFRLAAALSQEALAERAGLSARGISDLERGSRVAPRMETVRLLTDALALSESDRDVLVTAARPALSAASAAAVLVAPRRAPRPPGRLIGRQAQVADLGRMLAERRVRLVTLAGPGGVGKTRLALEVAREAEGSFVDGVCFIPLANIRAPELVMAAVARALDLRVGAGRSPLATLAETLRQRDMLLIFDNFEHVADAAVDLSALLGACPSIVALATSRVRLRLRGERLYDLAPLSLPDGRQDRTFVDALASEAVQLFIERAHEARPGFRLSPGNAEAVAGVCRRLDGLPLALELVASRIKVLSAAALLDRLDRRLPLLTAGARDLPERQRTMRDAIAWSFDLLSPAEQTLFCWLALAVGGVAFDTVESMAAAAGLPESVEALAGLLDSSLVQSVEGDHAPRFTMLETIREFGLERLAARGDIDAARAAHATYLLSRAEALRTAMFSVGQEDGLVWFEAERANVHGALEWLVARDPPRALHMTFCLDLFWYYVGEYAEGLLWTERARSANRPSTSLLYAHGCSDAAMFAISLGDWRYGVQQADASLDILRALGDEAEIPYSIMLRGWALTLGERFDAAETDLEDALARFERLDDRVGLALTLGNLASIAQRRGDHRRQETYLRRSLAIERALDDRGHVADTLLSLADLAGLRGERDQCLAYAREALALLRESGVRRGLADALHVVGCLEAGGGALDAAVLHLDEAIACFARVADHAGLTAALSDLADVRWRQTDRVAAIDAYQTALHHWRLAGSSVDVPACLRFARLAGRLGRRAEAARLLAVALEQKPVDEPASRCRDRLIACDVQALIQQQDTAPGVGGERLPPLQPARRLDGAPIDLAYDLLQFARTPSRGGGR